MSKKYEIIDNALDSEIAHNIENIMTSPVFPWFYVKGVASDGPHDINQFYFIHMFYQENSWSSSWAEQIIDPVANILQARSLIRIKGNFYPRTNKKPLKNPKHSDFDFSHGGAIYYVNSNDGFTVLEDGTKIESVANRILLFDPSLPHYSTHCTNQHGRVNINFNFF